MGGAAYGTITGLVLMWQFSGVFANHRRYQWNTSHPVDSESLATAPKTDVSVHTAARGGADGQLRWHKVSSADASSTVVAVAALVAVTPAGDEVRDAEIGWHVHI